MITYKKYEKDDFEIVYQYLLKYYEKNKFSSPFLPCNYVWGYMLGEGKNFDKQVLIYEKEKMIGLITFDTHPGEDFIFLDESYQYLMDDAITYCEEHLFDQKGELSFRFNELNEDFRQKLILRGYEKWWEDIDSYIKTSIDFPKYELPKGYYLLHFDDPGYDNKKADISVHLGFDNPPSTLEDIDFEANYRMLFTPHYDRHQKVSIVDEEGNYCANAHFWIDSDYCVLEPLSTHPNYRKKGLARYLLRYGYELAKENNCSFFRGGPMEYYVKAKMDYFKGYHYGKKNLKKES